MRLIHLGFQLHAPYTLGKYDGENHEYFDAKESFKQADEQIYQPFFALMERNTQKHAALRFSLMVSGTWLELAEQYDIELIQRLRKLVKMGRVELIAEPFHHSLAFFYDKEEFTEQVQLLQKKVKTLFDADCRIFATPDLMYNDALGKWAEDFGFAGMLVGGAEQVLDWRSPNHVYEAAGCEYLRLLFQNRLVSDKIVQADATLLDKPKPDAEKLTLSAKRLQKMLDLACLRGNLVNIYLDASVFAKQRENGIIALFDQFFANWLAVAGNKFVKATEACVVETPTAEVSVRQTVDMLTRAERKPANNEARRPLPPIVGLVRQSDVTYKAPARFQDLPAAEMAEKLYKMRRLILSAEDEYLVRDFRRLTAIDHLADIDGQKLEAWEKILQDLQARVETIKKGQAEEISKVFTKKRDRGLDAAEDVAVKIGEKSDTTPAEKSDAASAKKTDTEKQSAAGKKPAMRRVSVQPASDKIEPGDVDVKVVRASKIVVDRPEIELPKVEENKPKPKRIRKIIKKLVIE